MYKREANLGADASNQETLPVVQHGLLQETLLSLALQGAAGVLHMPSILYVLCVCV